MRTVSTSALILVGLLTLALLTFSPPPRADAALPPRPTLTPTSAPVPNLAVIVFHAGVVYDGAWTVVQWQGSDGLWHDVTGWQAHVRIGQVRWRVAEKDFNTGPFRWLIYDKMDGDVQAVSPDFTLPDSPMHVLQVLVTPVAGP